MHLRFLASALAYSVSLASGACEAPPRTPVYQSAASAAATGVFRSTFSGVDGVHTAPFTGRWRSDTGDMVLVPRTDRAGVVGLFGAMPTGPDEGALWLSRFAAGVWDGIHISGRTGATRGARVVLAANGESLALSVAAITTTFSRAGQVRLDLLARIAIYGHRGASLGRRDRENSLAAIRASWLLGCSGVEIDVTVPRGSDRSPLTSNLRVHHPSEWRAEITGYDSTDESAIASSPTLASALQTAVDVGLSGVYLDAKLKWLMAEHRDAARAAAVAMLASASAVPAIRVLIGAETSGPGEAADMFAALRRAGAFTQHTGWALEITRGTSLDGAVARLQGGLDLPDAVSWNLLRIDGGGGGFLRWFVRTVPPEIETALARRGLPFILWTADHSHFDAALGVWSRLQRGASPAAIMTAYPHRLIFTMATLS